MRWRRQGETTHLERTATLELQIEDVPLVLRALGFYPTEREMHDIVNELRFKDATAKSEIRQTFTVKDIIQSNFFPFCGGLIG